MLPANVPERLLEKVCSINYFDFGKLTWQQLLELKRSHFISDFRKQFSIWLNEYSQSKNELEFERKLDYFIKSSNFEFLKNNKPNLTKEILKAIADFIPFPKFNPISIYSRYSTRYKKSPETLISELHKSFKCAPT